VEAGAGRAERVDSADEIDPGWLEDATVVGVTSGASVPDSLVQAVVARLQDLGCRDVETRELVEETLTFALPHDLKT
ncbi:MAG: 4-hydroxy-3-methylbut-2-enyl diphosphate reductase, partial [Propionibacteriaceae bacterium]|nr:4-hydroxy-3-methylbut-2-enyl diphosphate reductase [Propionibacteriaceae bacterium]